MKLSEIANLISGKLIGKDVDIYGVSNLDVQTANTIAYVEKKKNIKIFANSPVAAMIIAEDMEFLEKPIIKVKNPKLAFSEILQIFSPYTPYKQQIYPNVYIEDSANIADNVTIMPFTTVMDKAQIGSATMIYSNVFIGKNVKIGKNCIIKSGVKIDDFAEIGDNVNIHHNTVIGGEGFGYIQDEGKNKKIPQIGKIIIKDNVEIGACVTIDRATLGETLIEEGVKIDNLVQIAHNVKIGKNSILVAQVGIAGSTTIGENCIFAGQVGVADHIEIGDNVILMAQSGIDKKKIESGSVLFGSPAKNAMLAKRISSAQDKLPEIVKTVRELKRRLLDEK